MTTVTRRAAPAPVAQSIVAPSQKQMESVLKTLVTTRPLHALKRAPANFAHAPSYNLSGPSIDFSRKAYVIHNQIYVLSGMANGPKCWFKAGPAPMF
jgi:hypothetical protein